MSGQDGMPEPDPDYDDPGITEKREKPRNEPPDRSGGSPGTPGQPTAPRRHG